MINEKLLTPKEVSDILKIKTTTLANWRYYEKNKTAQASNELVLKWIELPNGIIRYKETEVIKWIESQSIESKTEESSNI